MAYNEPSVTDNISFGMYNGLYIGGNKLTSDFEKSLNSTYL